jgi:hydrogenase nickel incorporation protein HypA/HybF
LHEFALSQQIFDSCIKTAMMNGAKKILEIYVELGDFTLVIEDFLRQSFDIIAKDSIASGAKLVMKRTPGKLYCKDCDTTSEIWFQKEKEIEEQNKELQKYESSVASISNLGTLGYQSLGINLFKCKKCGSRNTDLVGGKEIKLRNIKVPDDSDE